MATWSLSVLLPLIMPSVHGQSMSINIDWSAHTEDGRSLPHVHAPQFAEPSLERLLGYFSNSDGFYGRPGFVEYVRVSVDKVSHALAAEKIVGDANVPRGKLTWRTSEWTVGDAPTSRMGIVLQLRDDPDDPDGFWWSPAGNHEVVWSVGSEGDAEAFYIDGVSPRGHGGQFVRVLEEEALQAARETDDAA
jgi:hypothetical protein